MKRILALALSALLLILPLSSLSVGAAGDGDSSEDLVYIAIEGYGVITIQLYEEVAPITVANFRKLVNEGFYDGLIFHRVIEGFMVQGGDPKGDGTGGSGEEIKGEFSANNVQNTLKHTRGVVSMARSGHPYESYHNAGYMTIPFSEREPYYNSASSQFFIVHETSSHLDGNYAAFGEVTEGMDIVDKIAAVETDPDDNKPLKDVVMTCVTFDKAEAKRAIGDDLDSLWIVWVVLAVVVVGVGVTVTVVLVVRHRNKKAEEARQLAEKQARAKKKNKRK